jgi:hypothetical protein
MVNRKLISAFGGFAAVVGIMAVSGCQNQAVNVAANREMAQEWVTETLPGYTLAGFSSSTLDTDGDGYISVDITVRKGDELRLIQLQCATRGEFLKLQKGGGCKYHQMPFDSKF